MTKLPEWRREYVEAQGRNGFDGRWPESINPYRRGSAAFRAWRRGYRRAASAKRRGA